MPATVDRLPEGAILLLRPDRLGDVLLTLPAFAAIKQHWPDRQVIAAVSRYTAPIVSACPLVDDVWALPVVDGRGRFDRDSWAGRARPAAVISYFSDFPNAFALWRQRIPLRLGPSSKLAQVFYNHRVVQRRSASVKPEWAYNLDLSHDLIRQTGGEPGSVPRAPFLQFRDSAADSRTAFAAEHGLDAEAPWVFIHPGSGGSAPAPTPADYARVASELAIGGCRFVITAGPDELPLANHLATAMADLSPLVYHSQGGLVDFAANLRHADLFVSGSTGPAHLAGALARPTATFYPSLPTAGPRRWQTLAPKDHRFAFIPPAGADPFDMASIDYAAVGRRLGAFLLSRND
ncbi:glycosyltransferase family 9 protein [Salinisphaera sp. P385]|uniref:Glycosyltransferase family 9 protein n=1 Tax=Spectribacter acetivorans TaxID=3075603 RepID=A0ABU3B995_9GAMM|nr:glycosyltransferase family 9 protein [Salinisphaera sp. P385]MDT0619039.1 glycosyltransferase family 9 protein [Salinisphaera sp. P385]